MKIFLLLVALTLYCKAKPTINTPPDNPLVLANTKPNDEVVATTESERKSKSSVLSHDDKHHVSKRDHQSEHTDAAQGKPSVASDKSTVQTALKEGNPAVLRKDLEHKDQHKRDIPVPLEAKYHHSEESTKEKSDYKVQEPKREDNAKNHEHRNRRDVQVEDLSGVVYEKLKDNEKKTSTTELSTITPKPVSETEHKN
uniref:Uncharacterized protein n=1 Tax=Glossina brevipalpis TaxID=37001 RepID=A0A1A9WPZ0_9MUSC